MNQLSAFYRSLIASPWTTALGLSLIVCLVLLIMGKITTDDYLKILGFIAGLGLFAAKDSGTK